MTSIKFSALSAGVALMLGLSFWRQESDDPFIGTEGNEIVQAGPARTQSSPTVVVVDGPQGPVVTSSRKAALMGTITAMRAIPSQEIYCPEGVSEIVDKSFPLLLGNKGWTCWFMLADPFGYQHKFHFRLLTSQHDVPYAAIWHQHGQDWHQHGQNEQFMGVFPNLTTHVAKGLLERCVNGGSLAPPDLRALDTLHNVTEIRHGGNTIHLPVDGVISEPVSMNHRLTGLIETMQTIGERVIDGINACTIPRYTQAEFSGPRIACDLALRDLASSHSSSFAHLPHLGRHYAGHWNLARLTPSVGGEPYEDVFAVWRIYPLDTTEEECVAFTGVFNGREVKDFLDLVKDSDSKGSAGQMVLQKPWALQRTLHCLQGVTEISYMGTTYRLPPE